MMPEENNNEINEPAASYGEPLSFEKVWVMFQKIGQLIQEDQKKIMKYWEKSEREWAEIREEHKETERVLKEVSQIVGGQGASTGEVTEDFFRGALEGNKRLAGICYDTVDQPSRNIENLRGQYDIVLIGPDTVVVIEVKYKMRLNDVIRFQEVQLPAFMQLFPEYTRDKKVVGALAAMTFTKAAIEKASALQYMLLTQSGQEIKVLHPKHPKKVNE